MKKVTIHTDGGCIGNPGPGGWAAILRYGERSKEISGGAPATTNNRMEMQAAIEALQALKEPCEIQLFTDSEYLRDGMTVWVPAWKKYRWGKPGKQPVKNQDLWQKLDAAASRHRIHWHWVKGHNGHQDNERCDRLARSAAARIQKQHTPQELKALNNQFRASRRLPQTQSGQQSSAVPIPGLNGRGAQAPNPATEPRTAERSRIPSERRRSSAASQGPHLK